MKNEWHMFFFNRALKNRKSAQQYLLDIVITNPLTHFSLIRRWLIMVQILLRKHLLQMDGEDRT